MHTDEPSRLTQVFYISRSLAMPGQVEKILQGARAQNRQRGVTGLLLFTGGHFAQLLEGTATALADTMAIITSDRRHEAVKRLIDGKVDQRRFESWSMAFAEAPGADDLIEQLLALPEVPTERSQRLLALMFKAPSV